MARVFKRGMHEDIWLPAFIRGSKPRKKHSEAKYFLKAYTSAPPFTVAITMCTNLSGLYLIWLMRYCKDSAKKWTRDFTLELIDLAGSMIGLKPTPLGYRSQFQVWHINFINYTQDWSLYPRPATHNKVLPSPATTLVSAVFLETNWKKAHRLQAVKESVLARLRGITMFRKSTKNETPVSRQSARQIFLLRIGVNILPDYNLGFLIWFR